MTSIAILEAVNTSYVPFNGQQIITAMAAGVAYVAMKPIVENLGMSWGTQQQKLMKSLEKFNCIHMNMVAADGKLRKLLCLPLKKLNGWLFSINPEKVRADIRDKLIQYQEECFTVLHEYWTKGKAENPRKPGRASSATQLTPLRQTAERLITTGLGRIYPDIWKLVHKKFDIEHIHQLNPEQVGEAVEYLNALEGEFLGKQEALPSPQFNVSLPIQWWIDNNPVVRSGNLSFGKTRFAPSLEVTMGMLCGDNSTSSAIRLINILEEAGFDVSGPKAEIVAMRKHLANVEYGMNAISDACQRAGNKIISFRGKNADFVIN